jgi:hypothetical protein
MNYFTSVTLISLITYHYFSLYQWVLGFWGRGVLGCNDKHHCCTVTSYMTKNIEARVDVVEVVTEMY